MNNKTATQSSESKKSKELPFLKKCIILANFFQDKTKFLINPFNTIPCVKLYTANIATDNNFIYSKIKGALIFTYEESDNKTKYFLQIYDINDYSLVFNFPINIKSLDDIIVDEKFICIPTRNYFIGLKFFTNEMMKNFFFVLKSEKQNSDINLKAKEIDCPKNEIAKINKNIKDNLDKKLKLIGGENGKIEKDKNMFLRLEELYNLVNCIEYSELNNKLNIFIDKNINPYTIKSYIEAYRYSKDKKTLPYKIVFNDYIQIKDKNAYVELLVDNLITNSEEEKRLIIFKREHKKRHAKEKYEETKRSNISDIRASAMIPRPKFNIDEKNKGKGQFYNSMIPIKEESEESLGNNKKNKSKK